MAFLTQLLLLTPLCNSDVVILSIPKQLSVSQGQQEIKVPIYTTDLTDIRDAYGFGIFAAELVVSYNSELVVATGVELVGTIAEGSSINYSVNSSSIALAFTRANDFAGSGILAFILFDAVIDEPQANCNLSITQAKLNEVGLTIETGTCNTQTPDIGSSSVTFAGMGLKMDFNSNSQSEPIRVTLVEATPDGTFPLEMDNFINKYWLIEQSSGGTFNVELIFTLDGDVLTQDDESLPGRLRLFRRDSSANENWIQCAIAKSVNAVTGEVKFEGIENFSQFTICRTADTDTYITTTEIMYDAYGSDDNHEWLEIYNYSNAPINLSGWTIRENSSDYGLTANMGDLIIEAQEYAVIAQSPADFKEDYTDYSGTLISCNWDSLENIGEKIELKNSSGKLVESLTYPVPASEGHSVEKKRPTLSWSESSSFASIFLGGTPGTKNDVLWEGDDATFPTAWNVDGNWSSGLVPDSSDNIAIPDVSNEVILEQDRIIKNLTIQSGGKVNVASYTLTVSDVSYINGTLEIGTGSYDANGSFDATNGVIAFTDSGFLKLGNASVISLGNLTTTVGTVEYDYDGNQTVLAGNYFSLKIAGGVKTLAGNIDVDGDFESSAETFDMNANDISVAGNFTNSAGNVNFGNSNLTAYGIVWTGGTITATPGGNWDIGAGGVKLNGGAFIATTGNFTRAGDWNMTGVTDFTNSSETIVFDGTGTYQITSAGSSFYNLSQTMPIVS